MRKVYVEIKYEIILNMEEGIKVGEVINNIEATFKLDPFHRENVDIVGEDFLNYEIIDSK